MSSRGTNPRDRSSSTRPVPDFVSALDGHPAAPRIGLLRQFYRDASDREVRAHTDEAAERLQRSGAQIEEVGPVSTDFITLLAAHRVVMTVEAAAVHEADFGARPDDYSANVRSVVEAGSLTPAVSYVQAQRVRSSFRRDMLKAIEPFDVIMTPSTTSPAPKDLSTTGRPQVPDPLDQLRLPRDHAALGAEPVRSAHGGTAGGPALRGGGPAAGRSVVRAGAGYAADAAGLSRLAIPSACHRRPGVTPGRRTWRDT